VVKRCDVLAIGAHPDDVELGCGATLARLAARGLVVGIVDLTAGEAGTRGDAAVRCDEAERASAALGVAWRLCLDLPDGSLAADSAARIHLIRVLRAARPRVMLIPASGDPHPDHIAAAALAAAAGFASGAGGISPEAGPRHRVALLLAYPGPRQILIPTLIVDVTATYPAKRAALAAHASQFDPAGGAATHLASGHFLAAIEGRDRLAGNAIGVESGEGFQALGPLAADEVAWLLGPPAAAVGNPAADCEREKS